MTKPPWRRQPVPCHKVEGRRNRELARELDDLSSRYILDVQEDVKVVTSEFSRFARMLKRWPTE